VTGGRNYRNSPWPVYRDVKSTEDQIFAETLLFSGKSVTYFLAFQTDLCYIAVMQLLFAKIGQSIAAKVINN